MIYDFLDYKHYSIFAMLLHPFSQLHKEIQHSGNARLIAGSAASQNFKGFANPQNIFHYHYRVQNFGRRKLNGGYTKRLAGNYKATPRKFTVYHFLDFLPAWSFINADNFTVITELL